MKKILAAVTILSAITMSPAKATDVPLGFTETEINDQPDSFIAKKFTKDDGSATALFIAKSIDDDSSFSEYSPDKLIMKNVKNYLGCQSIDFKVPDLDEIEIYDGDDFKNCVTEDGKKYDGSVSVTGYFYTMTVYSSGISDYDKSILDGTTWNYIKQLCAQDCMPSGKFAKASVPSGYTPLPTFKTSLENLPVLASDTFINKQDGSFFSYQIINNKYKDDELLTAVSKFCEYQEVADDVKKKGDYSFSKCWKILLDHPNLISIKSEKYPKFTLVTMFDQKMTAEQLLPFEKMLTDFLNTFDPDKRDFD